MLNSENRSIAKPRWWIISEEPGGPWGPCEARDQTEAERIGKARMAGSGLTFVRVEPVDD